MLLQEKPFFHNPHYRAVFDIHASVDTSHPIHYIISIIINWLNQKTQGDGTFSNAWFYEAGEYCDFNETVQVKTISYSKPNSRSKPQYWALSLQEQCKEFPSVRNWYTEIAISQLQQRLFRFSIYINYLNKRGIFAEIPEIPVPTTPIIVQRLLNNPKLSCKIKENDLSIKPFPVAPGETLKFKEALGSPIRVLPILYISPDTINSGLSLDPNRMAKLLAANAAIFFGTNRDVNSEMEWTIPNSYRCINGMVRVYQPNLNFNHLNDYRRHRFFTKRKIYELGKTVIESNLVRGLVRESRHLLSCEITSYKDVINLIREDHSNAVKISGTNEELRNELELQRDANKSLQNEMLEFIEELEKQYQANSQLELNICSLESDKKRLGALLARTKKRSDFICNHCLEHISQLPKSLLDIIAIIAQIYPNRVRFTDKALKTAKKARSIDIGIAWNCLFEVATTLYNLYFTDTGESKDIEKLFKDKTTFDLALNEGKLTNSDSGLIKLREDEFEGEKILMLSHVKHGTSGPKLFRVYYFAHRDKKLLIIGHCGGHLPTYSTQKL